VTIKNIIIAVSGAAAFRQPAILSNNKSWLQREGRSKVIFKMKFRIRFGQVNKLFVLVVDEMAS
jgi:hypothetical protein